MLLERHLFGLNFWGGFSVIEIESSRNGWRRGIRRFVSSRRLHSQGRAVALRGAIYSWHKLRYKTRVVYPAIIDAKSP